MAGMRIVQALCGGHNPLTYKNIYKIPIRVKIGKKYEKGIVSVCVYTQALTCPPGHGPPVP